MPSHHASSVDNNTETAELRSQLSVLRQQVIESEKRAAEAERELALVKEQIAWFRKQVFDRSSEKSSADVSVRQGQLFNEVEAIARHNPASEESVAIPAHTRRKKGRRAISKDLPRIDVIHDLTEDQKICAQDGQPLTKIGEVVSEQLDYVPAKLRVLRHVRYKYVCKACRSAPVTAERATSLIPKSLASPSLLAHITTAKYVDGLPLYRQERQFQRLGLELNRATMANWMIRIGESAAPVVERLHTLANRSALIHMDETRIQVLRSHKAPTADHWVWVRAAGPPKQRIVLFDYDPSRGQSAPARLLDDFAGVLLTDGYNVYDRVAQAKGLRHAGCWAHARRYFNDAKKIAQDDASASKQALNTIGQLYRIEKQLRSKNAAADEILKARQQRSKPITNDFFAWLETLAHQVVPKSTLGKAVHYTLGQKAKLTQFLDDANIPLDNNRAENAIRPYVVGRKAWLFADGQSGAIASTRLYSLVETAKANGKEPHAYLAALYEQLPHANSVEDIDALLPWTIELAD